MISVDIILVTFKRLNFLKTTVKSIYHRTKYPYRLWVVNNDADDIETINWLKKAKLHGYLFDFVTLEENKGLADGFSEGFKHIKEKTKNRISEYIVTTQDDIVPPLLTPCWLERMLHIAKKYPNYGGISMRVQRIRHRDVNEHLELIESPTSLASVFRIQKKNDIEKIDGFGKRPHWESTSFMQRMKPLKKKLAVATYLYADHLGFVDNKGFKSDFKNYHTYAENRKTQHLDQPYPCIDQKTNIPLKINTPRDKDEQNRREEYWKYWGLDSHRTTRKNEDQKMLESYGENGKGIEIGPGRVKCNKNAIGVDIYPYPTADILGNGNDLWMFKDGKLDFVIASHNLEHYPDCKSVLKEWKRVLKIGGIIAVAVPDGELDPQVIRDPHKIAFTKRTLEIIFTHDLKMKVIRIENVPNKKVGHRSFILVAKK